MKHQINTLLISSLIILTGQAQAGLVRDGVWQIEEGDNLKSILKSALPEQPLRQKRLKRLSPLLNKSSFDEKGQLIVGQNLRLPGVKMPSNEVMPDSEQIGKILITNGPTTARAADGKQRVLNRGSAVNKGDTIQTQGARAQVRFTDGSLVALRPNTEFKVEEYSYSGQQDGSERGIYNLLKGGFRTISGAIGKVNKSNYRVKTAVATIGIRGTHYGVTLCSAGSCADQGLADGLYGGVVDGSIKTTNDGGSSIFNNDEYFLITDLGSLAQALLAPPGVIFDDPAAPTVPNEEKAGEKKKSNKAKRIEEIVAAIKEEKKPDFDGTTESEQTLDLSETLATLEELGFDLNNLPDLETLLAALNAQSNSQVTFPDLPGNRDESAVASFAFIGVDPNPLLPSDTNVVVVESYQDNGTTANINTDSSAEHSEYLSGLSFGEDQGNNIQIIASIIGTDITNLNNTGVDTGLGLIWGRWSNTPITAEATGGVSQSSTPNTGIVYAVADSTKVLADATALSDAATNLELDSTVFMTTVGQTGAFDLSGQRLNTQASMNLNFISQTLSFDVNTTNVGGEVYSLQTGTVLNPDILFSNIISPGSTAPLTGLCTGGICTGQVNPSVSLSGEASFLFTQGQDQVGNPSLGAAVTYAGQGLTPTGTAVGITGTNILSSSSGCSSACGR